MSGRGAAGQAALEASCRETSGHSQALVADWALGQIEWPAGQDLIN